MAILKPRARIIRTIGDQLVSGPEAAVIELVKNAYDADSPFVAIKLSPETPLYPAGRILVEDHGHGMTYDDIVGKWFEPASDNKLKKQISPKGRVMLGAKGIGRFAAARLGSQLTLESTAISAGGHEQVTVLVDWDEFTADRYLSDIEIPIERKLLRHTATCGTGVRLTITRLRETWTEKRISTLVRELRRLLSPGEIATNFSVRLDLDDFDKRTSGFVGRDLLRQLNRDIGSEDLDSRDPWTILPYATQDFADYQLVGEFSIDGSFSGEFTAYKADAQTIPLTVAAPPMEEEEMSCGPLRVRINVYDREAASVERLFERMGFEFKTIGIRAARKILTDAAGIAIFRNGFRIRPYGEPDHDWLELERQRVQNPSRKLGLSQVAGRIDIQSEAISHLVERSSREGLEHNGAFDRLKRLLSGVLIHLEEHRVAFREKAGLSRKAAPNVEDARPLADLPRTRRAAQLLPAASRQSVLEAAERDSQSLVVALEEIEEYQKVLQSRAALGLLVAEVLHEGRRILNPIADAATQLADQRDHLTAASRRGEIARKHLPDILTVLVDGTKRLGLLFQRLDPLAGRRRTKPRQFSVSDAVRNSLLLLGSSIESGAISLKVNVPADALAYGYTEDFQSALINIVENAIHWLGTVTNKRRTISIDVSSTDEVVRTRVANNGPPIDDMYIQRLFTPGFTLKQGGTGLGLAIAREACRASKGSLLFDDSSEDTTFVIEFPIG